MIELLSRLFARHDTPDDRLTRMAVDAIVAGTDPRLRAAAAVNRRLREPARKAIDYVRQIAEHLGPAVELNAGTFGADPRVHALFGSVESMRQTIGRDPSLRGFERDVSHAAGDEAFALLLADRQFKHVLGMDLQGDLVMRDLAKTLLVFGNHRLRAVAATEAESLRAVRIFAFRQLVDAAHSRLANAKSGQPIGPAAATLADDRDKGVAEIAARLQRPGSSALTLDDYLVLVADVFAHPERHLCAEPFGAVVDRMGALVENGDRPADAERVALWEIRRPGRATPTAALMVRLKRADFPLPRVLPELL